MKKKQLGKNFIFNSIICAIAFLLTVIYIIAGTYIGNGYNITIGSVSPQKFIADETVKNEVATQRLIDIALSEVSPLYAHDAVVQKKVIGELDSFFEQLSKDIQKLKALENSSPAASNVLDINDGIDNFKNQILNPANNISEEKNASETKVFLTEAQTKILAGISENEFDDFKNNIYRITNSALEQGIRQDTEAKTLIFIREELLNLAIPDSLSNIGYTIISSVIEPNLIVDTEATEKAKEDKIASIEPVMILKNQKIVDDGEIITEEIYSILNSLGYIQQSSISDNIIPITGLCIFLFCIFTATIFYIYTFHKDIYKNKKETILLFTLYALIITATRAMSDIPYIFVPVLTFTMLTSMLLNYKLSIVLNFSVSIICYIIYNGNSAFLLYFTVTGMFTALTTNFIQEHNKILKIGILNCFIGTFVIAGLTLYSDKSIYDSFIQNTLMAFINGIVTLILCIGSLPFWEAVFRISTSYKLLELINPNKELLRKLMLEAPGTYHHSIIVANLAEAAAYDIGANAALAKVGSYYHDIGKLKYPQYFTENIVGKNLHDYMDPYNSIQVIMNHVTSGLEFADEYKLPYAVRDIIEQHHGNTIIKFFYFKAKKKYSEDEVSEKDFRYLRPTPQSKEAAVVMLADTVEAAVRSKSPINDLTEIEAFVKTLIKDKLDDNQLADSTLGIKDLDIIANAFMGVFKGMYHERIPYPTDKDNKENKKTEESKDGE